MVREAIPVIWRRNWISCSDGLYDRENDSWTIKMTNHDGPRCPGGFILDLQTRGSIFKCRLHP